MSFLKKESRVLFKKHWNFVLENWFEETFLLVSRWTCALVGASENFSSVGRNSAVMSPNTFVGAARRVSQRESCRAHGNNLYGYRG
jgi:hypothetical protein